MHENVVRIESSVSTDTGQIQSKSLSVALMIDEREKAMACDAECTFTG